MKINSYLNSPNFNPTKQTKKTDKTDKKPRAIEPVFQDYIHIDADKLDLDDENIVFKLGIERNDYTKWNLFNNLSNNKSIIMSLGGGNISSGQNSEGKINFDFLSNINKFGENKVYYNGFICLPTLEQNITMMIDISGIDNFVNKLYNLSENDIKNIKDIKDIDKYDKNIIDIVKIYNDREKLVKTLKQRRWEETVDNMFNISKRNFYIMKELVKYLFDNNFLTGIIFYPTINQDNFAKYQDNFAKYKEKFYNNNPILNNDLFRIKTQNFIKNNFKFNQKRILCQYVINDEIKHGHITLEYGQNIEIDEKDNSYLNGITQEKYYKIYKSEQIKIVNNEINKSLESIIRLNNKILNDFISNNNLENDNIYFRLKNYEKYNELFQIIKDNKDIDKKILSQINYINQDKDNIIKKLDKDSLEIIKVSNFNDDIKAKYRDIDKFAHITINSGTNQPSYMKDVSCAISNKQDKITIQDKKYLLKDKEYLLKEYLLKEYLLKELEGVDISVNKLKIFYI